MLKKLLKDQRGLTLVELLAVIVILGIVAAIAVVSIGNVIQNTREDAAKADAIQIINAAQIFVAQNGVNPTTLEDEDGVDVTDEAGTMTITREALIGPTGSGLLADDGQMNPNWFVRVTGNGSVLEITGSAVAGSRTITFTNASVTDINNAGRNSTNGAVTIAPNN